MLRRTLMRSVLLLIFDTSATIAYFKNRLNMKNSIERFANNQPKCSYDQYRRQSNKGKVTHHLQE